MFRAYVRRLLARGVIIARFISRSKGTNAESWRFLCRC